jgi:putative ABC transport system permease protein
MAARCAIALIMDGYANSQAPGVVMSRQTQRLMGSANDDTYGLLMVRIKNTSEKDIKRVVDELNAMADGQYKAWAKEALAAATVKDAMSEGFIAIILTFMSSIGFVIGVVITWQTLRGAILANIKEFASLRALGVSIGQLRAVVMELSLWVGVLGVAAAGRADGRHRGPRQIGQPADGLRGRLIWSRRASSSCSYRSGRAR